MRFAFTDEQRLFARTVRDALAQASPPEEVRSAAFSHDRWRALAGLGLLGVTVPEADGGLGLGETDLVLALEETGYACLPEPVAESYVASSALRDAGDGPRAGAIAAGGLVATASIDGPVSHAASADVLVLASEDGLHAIARTDATIEPLAGLDPTRAPAAVRWEPTDATRIGGPDAALLTGARGAFAVAAQLIGVGGRCIEMAADHAKDRQQFGQPVGSFQAVKHLLANALVGIEFVRPVVYRAAWSLETADPEAAVHVSMAKAAAGDAAVAACRAALQVHGAIGYTEEHDLHLWLKRGFALAAAWGDAPRHRARVRAALL